MRSELSTQFYELLLQGRELIETPDNTLRAYLDFTRKLLKDYGIREDDTLQTIVNTLDKIYRDELSDANLPPSEIIEKGFEELQKQETLVKESRTHAAEAGKADQKRQEQTLAQRLRAQATLQAQAVIAEQKQPTGTTIYQPKPEVAVADIPIQAVPIIIGEPVRAMAQEVAKQQNIIFTPNQIDLIIKRTYQASFPVPMVPEAIKTEVAAQIETTLKELPAIEPQAAVNLKATLEELVLRQSAGAPEDKIAPEDFQKNIRLVIQEHAEVPEAESNKIADAVVKTTAPVEAWVQKAEVVIPLAQLAKEAPQAGSLVPAELKEQLQDQIQEILKEQQPTIPTEKLELVAEKLTDQTIESLSSSSPQKTTALKSFVQTTLEENGVVFVDRQKLDSFTNQVVDSAQPIQRWIQTAPVVTPVIAKMPTGESFSVLETRIQDTVQAVFENDTLFKGVSPEKIQTASSATSELFISQTLSPNGWKASQLLEPTKVLLEKQGLGFTTDEVRTVLGKIETVGQPTIIALEKIEKPIPEAVYAKLATEPQGVSPIKRITASLERVVSAPVAGAIINTPNKTPEWKEIADGKFGERYIEGAKTLVDSGMPKSHPTVVRMEEKGRRLIAAQQENGRDKPAVSVLKRYHSLSRLTDRTGFFDRSLGVQVPPHQITQQIIGRFSFERRITSIISGGRFTSFGSIQSTIYQKTFGRIAASFGKSKIGQTISSSIAKRFGVPLIAKGLTTIGASGGALAGLLGGPLGAVAVAAITVIPKAFSFIKNKLGLSSKTSGALIAGGMAIGGLFALATGGLSALGVGLLAIGGGSLLAMAPGFGIGIGGAISGLANGTGSILSAIGAGSAAGAPIAAGIGIGAVSISGLAFIIIMIASGAFILPTGGGRPTFPWTGTSTTCPAQFPVISAPAGLTFVWPIGPKPCSSNFGNRLDPFSPTECKCHTGIDIPGKGHKENSCEAGGSPETVVPAAKGTVYYAGNCGSYGNCVVIQHSQNLFSLYAHLRDIDPRTIAGAVIDSNQRLGNVGTTGSSTDCHLHLSFSNCGEVATGCFSQGEHTPSPCDYLPNCDASCTYKDQASGCAAP